MLVRLVRKLRPKLGFTLIELIMTIVVLAIVSIPISLLVYQQVNGTVQSEKYTIALNLARFEMEKVLNASYASVAIGAFNFPIYNGYNYDITRTVTYAAGSGATPESLKQVKVDIKTAGSATILLSLVTYLVNNVTYGL